MSDNFEHVYFFVGIIVDVIVNLNVDLELLLPSIDLEEQ